MSERGERGQVRDQSVPGTVWRVSLAWPVTDEPSRQERIDGLQQLLSTRSVVGLMGPGRPTRSGMLADLVLPVEEDKILLAKRDGRLDPGPTGADFAQELHRYTGAVVVNGDVARGDFAVLAAGSDAGDEALAQLLDEPLRNVLLVGASSGDDVREVTQRMELSAWLLDEQRPVAGFPGPKTDPTTLLMPGGSDLSVALRERAGRLDVLMWSGEEANSAPTRRRRSARRSTVVSTFVGARCRPIVLPEYVRPAGSPAATLLMRLDEDFAPLAAEALTRLGRLLPAARVEALSETVNEAPALGCDPEEGVLAPEQDGLLPGEELPEEPERSAHTELLEVLAALGEDPGLASVLEGKPVGGVDAETLGDPHPVIDNGDDAAGAANTADGGQAAGLGTDAGGDDAATRVLDASAIESASDSEATVAFPTQPEAAAETTPDATAAKSVQENAPAISEPGEHLTPISEAGDAGARARLGGEDKPTLGTENDHGGFASQLNRGGHHHRNLDFDSLLSPGSGRGEAEPVNAQAAAATQALPESTPTNEPEHDDDSLPLPQPAAGTPASSAGDDSKRGRRRTLPLVLLLVGVVLFVAAAVIAFFAPNMNAAVGTGYILAGIVGIIGIGLGVVGGTRLTR